MRAEPPDFGPMFRPGTRYRLPDPDRTVAVVEVLNAGLLHLPTGRVVACDPFWGSAVQDQVAPFTVTVPPGRYPVSVSAARTDSPHPDDPNPLLLGTAAKLTIREEPVVAWEPALPSGQDPQELAPDEIYFLGVDSGIASFFDAAAVAAVAVLEDQAVDLDRGELRPEHKRFLAELRRKAWANLVVDQVADLNVVMFDCGIGDGGYATWIGRTAAGAPACFIVDLLLLSDSFGPLTELAF
jgi:Protein of unknown function (DUF4241)